MMQYSSSGRGEADFGAGEKFVAYYYEAVAPIRFECCICEARTAFKHAGHIQSATPMISIAGNALHQQSFVLHVNAAPHREHFFSRSIGPSCVSFMMTPNDGIQQHRSSGAVTSTDRNY